MLTPFCAQNGDGELQTLTLELARLCWIWLLWGELSLYSLQACSNVCTAAKRPALQYFSVIDPENGGIITIILSQSIDFSTWLCCSVSLAVSSLSCLKWTNNHMASYYHTEKEHQIIAHEHWTCKCSCRMTRYTQTCGCSLWQMTARFFGRLKYIVVVGWRHVTTWHRDAYISCITS